MKWNDKIYASIVRTKPSSTGNNSQNMFKPNSTDLLQIQYVRPPANRKFVIVTLTVHLENDPADPFSPPPPGQWIGIVYGYFESGKFKVDKVAMRGLNPTGPTPIFRVKFGELPQNSSLQWIFSIPDTVKVFPDKDGFYRLSVDVSDEWWKNPEFSNVDTTHLNTITNASQQLTVYANFPNQWSGQDAVIIERRLRGLYEPTVDDFRSVANAETMAQIRMTSNISDLLNNIIYSNVSAKVERPNKSLKIVNIITHGSPSSFALGGSVDPKDGSPSWYITTTEKITADKIEGFCEESYDWLNKEGEGRTKRNKARTKLADDAQIVLYSCNAGTQSGSGILLKALSYAFQAEALGFQSSINYKLVASADRKTIISRNTTSMNENGPFIAGFKHLTPMISRKKTGADPDE